MELPQKCRSEINLGLDELFTNIISYGFEDESEHQIKFSLAKAEETLVVEIEDDGIPFNPLDANGPGVARDLDSIDIGGLGIHLVRNMMDKVSYRRRIDKNVITVVEYLEADSK